MRRAAPILLITFLGACPEPPPQVGTKLDLSVPATSPAPRIPLAPLSLRTQADFDALEARILGRREPTELLAALEMLAAAAKPAERPEDALLLMRLGVLYRDLDPQGRGGSEQGYLQKALALGTRLRNEAPDSPHTRYLQGYIPFAFLGGATDRAMVVTADTRELASACREQWSGLLAMAPDYDGPKGIDHVRIREVVAALDVALAQPLAPPPAGAAPAPAVAATRSEVLATNLLARFAAATDGDRKVLCRDWESGASGDASARAPLELELDLECSTFAGKVEPSLALITRLTGLEGAAFSPCLALARLRDRADPARADAAAKAAGLDCN